MKEVLIKRLTKTAKLPYYATDGSAAADITADCPKGLTLSPGVPTLVPTGLAMALPSAEYVGLVFIRSGLSLKGLSLSNGVGVIDSDYRGELKIALVNNNNESFTIEHGQRIAQLAVVPTVLCKFSAVVQLPETERGGGGFGSTGME